MDQAAKEGRAQVVAFQTEEEAGVKMRSYVKLGILREVEEGKKSAGAGLRRAC